MMSSEELIQLEIDLLGVSKVVAGLEKVSFTVRNLSKQFFTLNNVMNKNLGKLGLWQQQLRTSAVAKVGVNRGDVAALDNMFGGLTKKIDKNKKAMGSWGRQVGTSLSLMFGFMMLNRFATRVVKNIFGAYKEMTKGAITPLNVAFTRLSANVKFLSFQLIDSISPLLISFADTLSSLALSIAKSDPSTLKAIAEAIGGFAALTTLGLVGSQMFMFVNFGLVPIGKWFLGPGATAVGEKIPMLTRLAGALKKFAGIGLITVGLTFVFKGVYDFFSALKKNDIMGEIKGALEAALGISFVVGGAELLAGAGLAAAGTAAGLVLAGTFLVLVSGIIIFNLVKDIKVLGKEGFLQAIKDAFSLNGLTTVQKIVKGGLLLNPITMYGLVTASIHYSAENKRAKEAADKAAKDMSKQVDDLQTTVPSTNDLLSASILAQTKPKDIKELGTSISDTLTPALNDTSKGLNVPLAKTKALFKDINTETVADKKNIDAINRVLPSNTTFRSENAAALQEQADAMKSLAEAIRARKDAEAYEPRSENYVSSASQGVAPS